MNSTFQLEKKNKNRHGKNTSVSNLAENAVNVIFQRGYQLTIRMIIQTALHIILKHLLLLKFIHSIHRNSFLKRKKR